MTTLVNALLVESKNAFFWVRDEASISAWGLHEDTLPLGDIEDAAECTRIAEQFLATTAQPQLSIRGAAEPTQGDDQAFDDYDVGDTVWVDDATGTPTQVTVAGLDGSADAEGWLVAQPTFNLPATNARLRFLAWMKSRQGGVGGRASQASIVEPEFDKLVYGKVPGVSITPLSWSGIVPTGRPTQLQSAEKDCRLTELTVKAPPVTDGGHSGYVGTGSPSTFAAYRRLRGTADAGTIIGAAGGAWQDPLHPGWVTLEPSDTEIRIFIGNEFLSKDEEIWGVCISGGGHSDVSMAFAAAPIL